VSSILKTTKTLQNEWFYLSSRVNIFFYRVNTFLVILTKNLNLFLSKILIYFDFQILKMNGYSYFTQFREVFFLRVKSFLSNIETETYQTM